VLGACFAPRLPRVGRAGFGVVGNITLHDLDYRDRAVIRSKPPGKDPTCDMRLTEA